MNFTQEQLAKIASTFTYNEFNKIKTKPCRIKVNGRFISMKSGKTIWRNIGFAKLALIHHFKDITFYKNNCLTGIINYNEVKNAIDELVKSGIIEFVEAEVEQFALQKKNTHIGGAG